MKNDIFISYSRKDTNTVDEFVKRFEAEGFRVWIDRDGIESGDAFKRVIVNAIKESAIVVFFSSEPSNKSPWTTKEISIAVHYGKPIIPIKIDNSLYNEDLEFDLVNLDYIDYTDVSMRQPMMEKLVRTIKSKIPKRQEVVESEHVETVQTQPVKAVQDQSVEAVPPTALKENIAYNSTPTPQKTKSKKGIWIALAAVALLAALFYVFKDKIFTPTTNEIASSGFSDDLEITVNGITFLMKPVEGDSFKMVGADGRVMQMVRLDDYYMGETEVTQALWKAVTGKVPTFEGGWNAQAGEGDLFPAYKVSWNDIKAFMGQLNALTGKNFRLPTEAEWEFAARGGKKTNDYLYAGGNHVDRVAWYNKNSDGKTHEVKSKEPNELGLYDMSGNVWEWCSDLYDESAKDAMRVLRGGGWNRNMDRCQVNFRGSGGADFRGSSHGFRLALSR